MFCCGLSTVNPDRRTYHDRRPGEDPSLLFHLMNRDGRRAWLQNPKPLAFMHSFPYTFGNLRRDERNIAGCPASPGTFRTHPDRPNMLQLDSQLCGECGGCVAVCPCGALKLYASGLSIDHKECTLCENCVIFCPTGALEIDSVRSKAPSH